MSAHSGSPEISIILPVYNERENIEPLLDEIERVMKQANTLTYEVIIVDDGSLDGSTQIIRSLAQTRDHVIGILFRSNSGQSAAFDAGFRAATGKTVVTMDADRQNDPADISMLIAKLNEGYDVVSGWRRKRRDGFFLRTLSSRTANWLIRAVTRTRVHDLGCSLRVYRSEILTDLRLYGEMHRFLCPILEMMGARITEMEVHHRPRVAGKSKYGLARTAKVLLDLIHIWYLQNYRTKPIYLFGGCGAFAVFAGMVFSAICLYEKLHDGVWVHRNPLFLIGLASIMVGIQFIGVGLIAETLVRTYFESQGKTAYQVREIIGLKQISNTWPGVTSIRRQS